MLLDFSDFLFLQLLDYVTTTIFFSDKNVDSNLISWNRVVLLHGKWLLWISHCFLILWGLVSCVSRDFWLCLQDPQAQGRHPCAKHSRKSCRSDCQTGMTTLISEINAPSVAAPAFLIPKLPLSHCRYAYGQFVEINSHSLFSKWFSEVCLSLFLLYCSF